MENIRHKFIKEIKDNEFLWQTPLLFTGRTSITRILVMDKLYKKILKIPGVIMEFGVYYGRDLVLFQNLRGLYEPYNYSRRIIGFDTFEGFPSISEVDKGREVGGLSTPKNYETILEKILQYHEQENPIPQKKKFELVKGDVCQTVEKYLEDHPETIISLAYLDLDLCKPTKRVLEVIQPHLAKGSIIVFDELNDPNSQGETIAFKEVLGLENCKLKRFRNEPLVSYMRWNK